MRSLSENSQHTALFSRLEAILASNGVTDLRVFAEECEEGEGICFECESSPFQANLEEIAPGGQAQVSTNATITAHHDKESDSPPYLNIFIVIELTDALNKNNVMDNIFINIIIDSESAEITNFELDSNMRRPTTVTEDISRLVATLMLSEVFDEEDHYVTDADSNEQKKLGFAAGVEPEIIHGLEEKPWLAIGNNPASFKDLISEDVILAVIEEAKILN